MVEGRDPREQLETSSQETGHAARRLAVAEPPQQMATQFLIPDLDCPACARRVEEAMRGVAGVVRAHVNLRMGRAHLLYEPRRLSLPALMEAVKQAGYSIDGGRLAIGLQGIHCASCVATLERELARVPGVRRAEVNPGVSQVTLEYVVGRLDLEGALATIRAMGYTPVLPRPAASAGEPSDLDRAEAPPGPGQATRAHLELATATTPTAPGTPEEVLTPEEKAARREYRATLGRAPYRGRLVAR